MADDILALGVGDGFGNILTIALERRHDVERLTAAVTGADGAAVDHQGRAIHTSHRHDDAGHVFVAAGDGDEAVIPLRTHNGFDGVGDEVARLQREAHAARAHGNAVRHPNRVETHPDHVGGPHALFDLRGDVAQVHIARIAVEPHAGDTDLGALHIGFGQPRGVQHSLRRPLRLGLGDVGAGTIELCVSHNDSSRKTARGAQDKNDGHS